MRFQARTTRRPWKQSAPEAMRTVADGAGRRLGDVAVLDLQGHEVRLRAIYEQGPVVLVWLRHYG